MSLVKSIVDLHKASISLDSIESRGSCFTLRFPAEFGPKKPMTAILKPSTLDDLREGLGEAAVTPEHTVLDETDSTCLIED